MLNKNKSWPLTLFFTLHPVQCQVSSFGIGTTICSSWPIIGHLPDVCTIGYLKIILLWNIVTVPPNLNPNLIIQTKWIMNPLDQSGLSIQSSQFQWMDLSYISYKSYIGQKTSYKSYIGGLFRSNLLYFYPKLGLPPLFEDFWCKTHVIYGI